MPTERPVCYCSAYPFPHRAGGGACPGEAQHLCAECGLPATPITINVGIGSFEYWGQRLTDTRLETVSRCGHAPLLNNTATKHEATL